MRHIAGDLRYAWRSWLKTPGIALVVIGTLALAIGASTAIFSVIHAVLVRPLGFGDPDRIVQVWSMSPNSQASGTEQLSWLNIQDLGTAKSLDSIAGWARSMTFLQQGDAEPERLRSMLASASLFRVLGVEPLLGRTFSAEEDAIDGPRAAVLSWEVWRRNFDGDRSIVGRTIPVGANATPTLIVGVMPQGFRFPVGEEPAQIWMPLGAVLDRDEPRGAIWIDAVARLRNGVSLTAAQAEVREISERLSRDYPASNLNVTYHIGPLQDRVVREVRPALLVLFAAALAVLIIAATNVANILLSRSAARQREIAIRSSIGASSGRIVGQLLTESVALALIAGVLGLLLAWWGVDALLLLAPKDIPSLDRVQMDAGVLGFALAISVVTGLLFGLVPAFGATRVDLSNSLRDGGHGSTHGLRAAKLRNGLVVAEVALAIVLLVVTGLLLRSFGRLSGVDPGFEPAGMAMMKVAPRSSAWQGSEGALEFHRRVTELIATNPDVAGAAASSAMPFDPSETVLTFTIEGEPEPAPGESVSAILVVTTPGWFELLQIPLLQGRTFQSTDREGTERVVVVNDAFVRQHFKGQSPIGRRMNISSVDGAATVVGVVSDVVGLEIGKAPEPVMYLPHAQQRNRFMMHVARVRSGDAGRLVPIMRGAVRSTDRMQPVIEAATLAEKFAGTLGARRFGLVLLVLLAGLAIVLAAVGIYGVMSYRVVQRTQEIGIRMALGADAGAIRRLIIGGAMKLVLIGVVLGAIGAFASSRIIAGFLYGVRPADPITWVAIVLLLTTVAFIASWIPSARAVRIDPNQAIRQE